MNKTINIFIVGIFCLIFQSGFSQEIKNESKYIHSLSIGNGFYQFNEIALEIGYSLNATYLFKINPAIRKSRFLMGGSLYASFPARQKQNTRAIVEGEPNTYRHAYFHGYDLQFNYGWHLVNTRVFDMNLLFGNGLFFTFDHFSKEKQDGKTIASSKRENYYSIYSTFVPSIRFDFNFKFGQHYIGLNFNAQILHFFKNSVYPYGGTAGYRAHLTYGFTF